VNKAEKIDQLTPYQLEFPKEALPEIFVKDALTNDERMWVPQSENVWFRPLCLNRSQGYWVTLLKVKKAGVLSRHRHPQGVHGFVIKGRWEYLEHDWVAEEGSYIYEPPGETHTLIVPEGVDEMITFFQVNVSVGVPEKPELPLSNYEKFFSTKTYLTVSGQLQAEAFALSLRNVYTFGPTFRAERSNTQKHASEFWMVEPEMAFCDIECAMKISEEMIKYVVGQILENCIHEIDLLNTFVDKGLRKKLQELETQTFKKITHKEAIDILINSKQKFDNEPNHAKDLNSEHEKYLTDVHFKCPVFIKDWPKNIKAFYMRENSDKKTVAAFDLLVSGGVELVGGSQREERMGMLKERMKSMNVKNEGLEWYLDLRKYGGVVHSGFGLGFDRLIMYFTSTENIRDAIPFPRTPNNCKY
jgi:asparaginyl-tRNA synthetase